MKRIVMGLLTFATVIAPIVSQSCRAIFYEELEPENFNQFCKKIK